LSEVLQIDVRRAEASSGQRQQLKHKLVLSTLNKAQVEQLSSENPETALVPQLQSLCSVCTVLPVCLSAAAAGSIYYLPNEQGKRIKKDRRKPSPQCTPSSAVKSAAGFPQGARKEATNSDGTGTTRRGRSAGDLTANRRKQQQ
jgi:hypothetical protein